MLREGGNQQASKSMVRQMAMDKGKGNRTVSAGMGVGGEWHLTDGI